MKINSSFAEGFLDGFSGIGLFMRLRRPSAPDELIDSRPYQEFLENDFALLMTSLYETASGEDMMAAVKEAARKYYSSGSPLNSLFDSSRSGWEFATDGGLRLLFSAFRKKPSANNLSDAQLLELLKLVREETVKEAKADAT